MKLNLERLDQVRQAIDKVAATGTKYTFDEFCSNNGLYHEHDRKRIDGIFINCPFHSETTPSLLINEEKRKFNCFGCGAHGGYLEFITMYDNTVTGAELKASQKANELLRGDAELQGMLGFTTVFQKECVNIQEFKKLDFKRFELEKKPASTYLELASKMQKRKCELQQIMFALILMQQGLPPEVIERQVFELSGSPKSENKYSIEELNEE